MKIAIFIKKYPKNGKIGGLEVQNDLMVNGLRKEGYHVEVIETEASAGDDRSFEKFKELDRKDNFDLVISQSAAGAYYIKKRKDKIPFLVIQHGTLLGEIKTRLRAIRSVSNLIFFIFRIIPYGLKAYFFYDIKRLMKADKVIAVSDVVAGRVKKEYPFLKKSKIITIYNGTEIDSYRVDRDSLRRREADKRDFRFIFVGKMFRSKGVHILLKALSKIPEKYSFKLQVLGDGPEESNLKSLTKDSGLLDKVEFPGYIDNKDIPEYYKSADMIILPTLRDEGMPMVLIQACAASLPIISSRIGGIPNILKDGVNGILVEPGDVEGLYRAILSVIKDSSKRKRMGENSYKIAREHFSLEAMVEGYDQVIKELTRT